MTGKCCWRTCRRTCKGRAPSSAPPARFNRAVILRPYSVFLRPGITNIVIASESEAIQNLDRGCYWIASSLALLAMTRREPPDFAADFVRGSHDHLDTPQT